MKYRSFKIKSLSIFTFIFSVFIFANLFQFQLVNAQSDPYISPEQEMQIENNIANGQSPSPTPSKQEPYISPEQEMQIENNIANGQAPSPTSGAGGAGNAPSTSGTGGGSAGPQGSFGPSGYPGSNNYQPSGSSLSNSSYSNTPTAAGNCDPSKGKICNPIKATSLMALVFSLLSIVKFLAGMVLVFYFIWAGFRYVTARGDEGKIKEATSSLKWTAVGGAILLGAEVIARLIQGTITQLGAGL